ncbi:MAG TPA: hypothetical protein DCM08_06585 [Microscillaceae bacterium]|jgi:uncharacterized protein YukE|nr:hypothetical protein [Microscillaceae bacterium]
MSIGYTPVVIALLGFFFLWAIVHYSTYQAYWRQIVQLRQQLTEGLRRLSQKIDAFLQTNPELSSELQQTLRAFVDKSLSIQSAQLANSLEMSYQLMQTCETHFASQYSAEWQQWLALYDDLARTKAQCFVKIRHYNSLLEGFPATWFAKLTGFKKAWV